MLLNVDFAVDLGSGLQKTARSLLMNNNRYFQ
jgi:hypothetical protein